MVKKLQIILLLISISVSLGLMSTTYSRYVANTTGNIDLLFAKWQVLVNESDITDSSTSSVIFTPVMDSNSDVASNMVAPGSTGYFDIEINPENTDVSFNYTIDLAIENTEIPDLLITQYAILDGDYIEGDAITTSDLVNYSITNDVIYDNETEDFAFETFTIRVYFEWYDEEDGTMDDEADSVIGNQAATTGVELEMSATLTFEQIFN